MAVEVFPTGCFFRSAVALPSLAEALLNQSCSRLAGSCIYKRCPGNGGDSLVKVIKCARDADQTINMSPTRVEVVSREQWRIIMSASLHPALPLIDTRNSGCFMNNCVRDTRKDKNTSAENPTRKATASGDIEADCPSVKLLNRPTTPPAIAATTKLAEFASDRM